MELENQKKRAMLIELQKDQREKDQNKIRLVRENGAENPPSEKDRILRDINNRANQLADK